MANDNIQYDVHDYEPVNKYIEDQARLKRSASTWRYAKSVTLIMTGLGERLRVRRRGKQGSKNRNKMKKTDRES